MIAGAEGIMRLVELDLGASRGVLERLLKVEEALNGAAVTTSAALLGLAFANDEAALAWINLPVLVVFWLIINLNRVHFHRVSARVARLERIMQSYVVALREGGGAKPAALRRLDRDLDSYTFGSENSMMKVTLRDIRRGWHSWQRTAFFVGFTVMTILCGVILSRQDSDQERRICVESAGGLVAELDSVPEVSRGQLLVVPCPAGTAVED